MMHHELVDDWRARNPGKRDYRYYSGRHNSYSRIDFILVSRSIYSQIRLAKIEAWLYSDHAAVIIAWENKGS